MDFRRLKLNSDRVFSEIVKNAFDFLEKSISQFEESPKFSTIHFHAAVELFFKARLLKEHWALIVIDPKQANEDHFISGKFTSVSIVEANRRLNDICKDGLDSQQLQCFKNLTEHRNRMVHFFHTGQSQKRDLELVVSEQCIAWYYLNKAMTLQWKESFRGFEKNIEEIDKKMLKHHKFLSEKYELIKTDIQKKIDSGLEVKSCPSCSKLALIITSKDAPVFKRDCMVCKLADWGLLFDCPECDVEQWVSGDCWVACNSCSHNFDGDEIGSLLCDTGAPGDADVCRASCADCDGYERIVRLENGNWFCPNCFILFEESEIGQCEWCTGFSSGLSDYSRIEGCAGCEGQAGWTKDD